MELSKLDKKQKLLLFVLVPVLLVIFIIFISTVLSPEEKKMTEENNINTTLPVVKNQISETKISAYKKDDNAKIARRQPSDFKIKDYDIILNENEKQTGENNDSRSSSTENESRAPGRFSDNTAKNNLRKNREDLIQEEKAMREFNSYETYDPEKVEKRRKQRETSPADKPVQDQTPEVIEERPSNSGKGVSFHSIKVTGISSTNKNTDETNAIPAYIHGNQIAKNGSLVKIRIGKEVTLSSGQKIPANSFVYGFCSFKGERLNIKISQAQVGSKFLNCKFDCYGTDGNLGINAPGSVQREENKKSSGRGIRKIASAVGAGVSIASGGVLGSVAETATESVAEAVGNGASKSVQEMSLNLYNNDPIFLR